MCYTESMLKQIAAFDVGDKRIGVAFSDPFGDYAVPGDTYFRTGDTLRDAEALAALCRARGVEEAVCGLPLNADGTESVQSEKTRRFAEALSRALGFDVALEDERYTTREARRDLVSLGVSSKRDKKKKNVDSLAAAYILEGYLAKRRETMKEKSNDYEDDSVVELIDDDGVGYRYEHLMTFSYKGEWYCALAPETAPEEAKEDEEDEGEEIAIFRIVGEEEDEHLETIEDEALLDEVFAEFCNQYEDFEDADEAESLDSDGE